MSNKPRISEAEWAVMKVLWCESPITANRIIATLAEAKPWKPKTVRTLINRLLSKGVIIFDKHGREYLYRPVVSEADCLQTETRSVIQKAGAKALKPILAAFIEEQALSEEDIRELRGILDKKEGGGGDE